MDQLVMSREELVQQQKLLQEDVKKLNDSAMRALGALDIVNALIDMLDKGSQEVQSDETESGKAVDTCEVVKIFNSDSAVSED